MLAELEHEVEKNEEMLKQYEETLLQCPAATKGLIEKIQIVMGNIKQQEEENESIEKRV